MEMVFDGLQLRRAVDLMGVIGHVVHGGNKKIAVEFYGEKMTLIDNINGTEWKTSIKCVSFEEVCDKSFSVDLGELQHATCRLIGKIEGTLTDRSLIFRGLDRSIRIAVPILESPAPAPKWDDWRKITTRYEKTGFGFRRLADLANLIAHTEDPGNYRGIKFDFSEDTVELKCLGGNQLKIATTKLPSKGVRAWAETKEIAGKMDPENTEALFFDSETTRLFRAVSWVELEDFYLGKNATGNPAYRFDAKIGGIDFILRGSFEQMPNFEIVYI